MRRDVCLEDTNQGSHRQYYHEGNQIPSCTEVISMLNKPELVGWANYMGFKRINTKQYVEEKAKYGTRQHELFDLYFSDGIIKLEPETKDTIYKFRVLELYFEKLKIRVLNTEFPVEGSLHGGTMDMIVHNQANDCLAIYDLKTSKEVRQTHWIQLMGYVELIEEVYQLPVKEIGVILLSESMYSPKLMNIRYTKDCWREREIFDALRTVWYKMHELNEATLSIKGLSGEIKD